MRTSDYLLFHTSVTVRHLAGGRRHVEEGERVPVADLHPLDVEDALKRGVAERVGGAS